MNSHSDCINCFREQNSNHSTCCSSCSGSGGSCHTNDCNKRNEMCCNDCGRKSNKSYETCCQGCGSTFGHTQECDDKNMKNIKVFTANVGSETVSTKKAIDGIIKSFEFTIGFFQEAKEDLNKNTYVQYGYQIISIPYNFKNNVATLWLLILVKIVPNLTISINKIMDPDVEDSSIKSQKFTNLVCVTIKMGNKSIHIVNVHLKGGKSGYTCKQKFISAIIKSIGKNSKEEDTVILAGDFNCHYLQNDKDKYGLTKAGFIIDTDIMATHKGSKYDFVFTKNLTEINHKTVSMGRGFDHDFKIVSYVRNV